MNSRIWKWLSILQGYNVDIQHIPGKRNPADSLSRQSVEDALVRKSSVHDANAAYVQRLRVPENASDSEIQAALNRLFNQSMGTEDQSVLKMTVQDNVQYQEQLLNQIKPDFSDQDQVQAQCPRPEKNCKLSILRSGVLIDAEFKNKIHDLLKIENPYDLIIEELEAGKVETKKKNEVYKMKKGMLVVHEEDQNTEDRKSVV